MVMARAACMKSQQEDLFLATESRLVWIEGISMSYRRTSMGVGGERKETPVLVNGLCRAMTLRVLYGIPNSADSILLANLIATVFE